MLSVILPKPDPNEVSFSDLQNVAVAQCRDAVHLLAVDAHATLIDKATRVTATAGEACLDERSGHIAAGDPSLPDLVGADRRPFLQAVGEVLASDDLLQCGLAEQAKHVRGAQRQAPFRVAVDL